MKIALALLSYNTRELTLQTLKSIEEMELPHQATLEILLVDNHSSDDSISAIKKQYAHLIPSPAISKTRSKRITLTIIEAQTNLGFTGGNNLAAEYAAARGADYLLLLNSDTYAHQNMLKELHAAFKHHPQAGIVSPKIYFAPGYEFHKDRYSTKERGKVIWFAGGEMDWDNIIGSNHGVDEVDTGQYDKEVQLELTTGCCMLIRKELFTVHYLYDDRYFLYYEDADLCQRTRKLGYEIWYIPSARLWHVNAGSSGSGGNVHDYFITRNRLLFGMTYARTRTKFALFRESLKTLFFGRSWQKKAIIDYYTNRLNRGSFPIT